MERTHKTWGDKWNIFCDSTCEVSFLDLRPMQRCSWHRHRTKFNLFFVIQGTIYILTECGEAQINAGQTFTTRPGEWHEFRTKDLPSRIIEVMYVAAYDAEDIERKSLGGPLETYDEQ